MKRLISKFQATATTAEPHFFQINSGWRQRIYRGEILELGILDLKMMDHFLNIEIISWVIKTWHDFRLTFSPERLMNCHIARRVPSFEMIFIIYCFSLCCQEDVEDYIQRKVDEALDERLEALWRRSIWKSSFQNTLRHFLCQQSPQCPRMTL